MLQSISRMSLCSTKPHFPLSLYLIRHAESVFNVKCTHYSIDNIYSKNAEKQFHHDPAIIDCPITQATLTLLQTDKINSFLGKVGLSETLFCVSPLQRTLQTMQLILGGSQGEVKGELKVLVVPELAEILSKICDFSSGVKDKKLRFQGFDFSEFDRWMWQKQLSYDTENWQDPFVDPDMFEKVNQNKVAAQRYLALLKQIFPKPLQNPANCQARSKQAYKRIVEIAKLKHCKNIVIVSHNRVLKYIQNYVSKAQTQAQDFDNLEIRELKIPLDTQGTHNRE